MTGPTAAQPPVGPADRVRRIVVWLLAAAYAAFFSAFTIARHEAFDSGAFDLGFMDQAAWNTIRGDIMGVTIEPWQALTHLGYHFDPILIPISLTYLIYPSPHSLLIVQSVALALGALPASWLARRRLGNNWAAIVFAAAYLLYPGLQAANVYDFHAFTLSAPLILFCFWFVETRRYWWLALSLVLTMATKENVPLTTAMLGVYMAGVRRTWLAGAITVVASIAWFLFATYVAIPYFNVEGQGWLWNRYGGMGGTPFQIVGFLLENPRRLLFPAPELNNLTYVVRLLLPLALLSLLDPFSLAVGLPALATNVLTVYEPMHMLETYHYTSTLVGVIVASAIFGTERAGRWTGWVARRVGWSAERWRGAAITLCAAATLVCSLAYHYYRGYTPLSPAFQWPRVTAHHAVGREIAATLPPDAVVSAQSSVYPHVSGRDQIWMFPYVGPAEYIFLDVASQPNMVGLNEGSQATLRETIDRPDFGWVVARAGYVLLRRGEPHRPLPDEFFDFARVADPRPMVPLTLTFGDSLRLIGFDYRTRRDANVDLDLYWQALRPLPDNYSLPIYLTDRQGHELGATGQPQPVEYWYGTSRWQVGETVRIQTVNLPFLAAGRSFGLALGATRARDPWDVGGRLLPRVDSAPWRTPTLSQGTPGVSVRTKRGSSGW